MKTRFFLLLSAATGALCLAATTVPGQNWTLTSAPTNAWSAVAASRDLSNIVAVVAGGGIYISTNSGDTWILSTAPSNNWSSVASSADAMKLVATASGGGIWASTNAGDLWLQTSAPETNWSSVACSADGSKLVAAVYGGLVYNSTNSGNAWRETSAPDAQWTGVASSGNGAKLAGARRTYSGNVVTSSDYGATWTERNAPWWFPVAIACSEDGSIMASTVQYVRVSTDSGVTWSLSGNYASWGPITLSADGSIMATLDGHTVRLSADIGTTWGYTAAPSLPWKGLAMSGDGHMLVALVNGGGIYLWQPKLPIIAAQPGPATQTVPCGVEVVFSVKAVAIEPLSYQWQFNGDNLAGDTNAVLALADVELSHSGAYTVLVSNIHGSVLSQAAQLTVLPAIVSTLPSEQSLYDAVLKASVTPGSNLTVVWFEWGADTSYGNKTPATDAGKSATPAGFAGVITNLTPYTTYHYRVVASNSVGQVVGSDVSFVMAPRFVATGSPIANWAGIACSTDGTRLVGLANNGALYTSTDSGRTWNSNYVADFYVAHAAYVTGGDLAASTDTMKLAVPVGSAIFTSSDGGTTWLSNSTPTALTYVKASADGSRLAALGNHRIYTSTDSGVSWIETSAPASFTYPATQLTNDAIWRSVASSADGMKLAAVCTENTRAQWQAWHIFMSTNGGLAWNERHHTVDPMDYIASSADGTKLVEVGGYGRVYVSSDSGFNWVQTDQIDTGNGPIASSADGTNLIAAGEYNPLFTSGNSGLTWVIANAPRVISTCVAISADGRTMAAGTWGGHIYIFQANATPALSLVHRRGQALISWPALGFPMSFALQEATSLFPANWTDVSVQPELDATNCQHLLQVPTSDGFRFYRLRNR